MAEGKEYLPRTPPLKKALGAVAFGAVMAGAGLYLFFDAVGYLATAIPLRLCNGRWPNFWPKGGTEL